MMGSIFTKRKDESRAANSTKVKKRSGQSNPRNAGSTQSLYIDRLEVSSFTDLDLYYQPEDTQSLPRYHSSKDLPGQTTPRARVPPRRNKPLPVPVHHQENRINSQSQSQTFEDLPGKASPSLPWRSKTLLNKQTENRKKDATEKEDSENYYDSPESNSKPKVRADRNYEPYYDYDISFRKGNILQLINDGEVEGWYYARNLTTYKEGFVPKDWVTMITSVDVESQKGMDRELAEEILIEPETEVGTYLLRPSGAGSYALSLRCQSELYELEIKHYKIQVVGKGKCYIDADANNKIFSNIVELIKYYTEMPGLRCRLKTPLPQDTPLDALVVKFADLKLGEKLGSGNFSSVYEGSIYKSLILMYSK